MKYILRQVMILIVTIAFVGCGSGGDDPFVRVPQEDPSGTVLQGFVANASIEGLYNSISVSYSPVTSPQNLVPRVFNTDIRFNVNGFAGPNPMLFITDPIQLIDYNFPQNNTGLGQMVVETNANLSGIQQTASFATEPAGRLAVFGLESSIVSTPVMSVQIKALPSGLRSLSASDFDGKWGYVSMRVNGSTTIAELDFTSGVASGVGFSSIVTGLVSSSLTATSISTYGLNSNGDKLVFEDSTWFVNTDHDLAMTGEASGAGSDRLAFLFRPSEDTYVIRGEFDVFQLLVSSINSSINLTGLAPLTSSEIVRIGKINFADGTASMLSMFGVTQQNVPYQLVTNSSMWRFPALEQNFNNDVRLRIMLSRDQKLLFGVDYSNDQDARTAIIVGVRSSLACTDISFCP